MVGLCGLPVWFGRNLDAWSGTGDARGVSGVIDGYGILFVHIGRQGLFGGHREVAGGLAGIFDAERDRLVVHVPA